MNIYCYSNEKGTNEKGTDLFCEAQRVRLIAFLGL